MNVPVSADAEAARCAPIDHPEESRAWIARLLEVLEVHPRPRPPVDRPTTTERLLHRLLGPAGTTRRMHDWLVYEHRLESHTVALRGAYARWLEQRARSILDTSDGELGDIPAARLLASLRQSWDDGANELQVVGRWTDSDVGAVLLVHLVLGMTRNPFHVLHAATNLVGVWTGRPESRTASAPDGA
jgi:hypothetical protein